MIDYLAIALAQREEEDPALVAGELAAAAAATEASGGHLFRMEKTPPGPPEKMPRGGRFDSPSPWTPTPTDQGRGAAAPLALEPSPGRPTEGEEARFPHSVAVTGHGGSEDLSGPAAHPKAHEVWADQRSALPIKRYFQRLVSKFGGLVPQHRSPRGPGAEAPGGFLGGLGGYSLTSKNSPPGVFPSTGWKKRFPAGGKTLPPLAGGEFPARNTQLDDEFPGGSTEEHQPPVARANAALEGPAAIADAAAPLLRRLQQAQWGAGFVQGQRRQLTVTLPEATPAAPALSAEELDLACERDARRYGGGFGLY